MQQPLTPEERLQEARALAKKLQQSKKLARKEMVEEYQKDAYLQSIVAELKKHNGRNKITTSTL
ncbi:MAG: hypothetical protein ACK4GN_04555 [Runella sp.]